MKAKHILISLLLLTASTVQAEERSLSLGYISTGNPGVAYKEESTDKGILVDLATEIGKRSGIAFQPRVTYQKFVAFDLREKKLDSAIAGIYHDEPKDSNYLYSDSFLDDKVINEYRLKGLKRNQLRGTGDPVTGILAGAYDFLERVFDDNFNNDCKRVERGEENFKDLQGNPVKEPCEDEERDYIGLNVIRSGYFDHILHKGVKDIDFYLVLQKEHAAFLPAINAAIVEIKKDGTVGRFFEAYLKKKKTAEAKDGK